MRKLAFCSLLATLSMSAATAFLAPVASADHPLPTEDPFYQYDGSIADVSPGTVLRTRAVDTVLPGTATQVLYRTIDQQRRPSVTAALVVRPTDASGVPRILSYQEAYDALGAQCDPSYTAAFGTPGLDHGVLAAALAAGYAVVTADYEGPGLDYGAGQEAGYGTLDGIRAAEQVLNTGADATPVAMMGFSGGGIATEWAGELAAAYAPELNIVGAVEGGLPVNIMHTVDYIDGSPSWSKVLPLTFTGMAHGFGIDLTPYLSDYGIDIMNRARGLCANDAQAALPVIRMREILKPEYADYHTFSPLVEMSRALEMGTSGTPRFPILLGAGNSDGTGDGVMITADEHALAQTFCARGVPVDYREYAGADHVSAGLLTMAASMSYLAARFAGEAPTSTC